MYHLIKSGKKPFYFVVDHLEPGEVAICSDESWAVVDAARKIAEKTGVTKLVR